MSESAAAQLRAKLSAHFEAPVQLELVSTSVNSVVYLAMVSSAAPIRIAVKCCRDPLTGQPDVLVASEQIAALERVGEAFQASRPNLQIPQLLYSNQELAAIGMRWLDGHSLTRTLANPLVIAGLGSAMRRAGAWLGTFHRLGPLRSGRFNYGERRSQVECIVSEPLRHPTFRDASRALARSGESLDGRHVQVSWLHGDCKTDNFLLSDSVTYGIDFSVRHENCVEHDLAQFLNHLSILLATPRFLHIAVLRSFLENAFWQGYRSTGPEVSAACLGWIRLWALLQLWKSTIESRDRSAPSCWLINRIFAKVCAPLTSNLALAGRLDATPSPPAGTAPR